MFINLNPLFSKESLLVNEDGSKSMRFYIAVNECNIKLCSARHLESSIKDEAAELRIFQNLRELTLSKAVIACLRIILY
jgi:hypothetical protein